MKKLIAMTLLLGGSTLLCAQKTVKIPAVYKPVKSEMYKKGWIDFNKNGVKNVYEDPNASLDARIEDLLSQMTLEEKTCQMVTLYGYKRVLKDDLTTAYDTGIVIFGMKREMSTIVQCLLGILQKIDLTILRPGTVIV